MNLFGSSTNTTSREKNYDSVQHALRNPFVKGKQSSFQKPIWEIQTCQQQSSLIKERNNNESTDSVQKNINSATSHPIGARRARVASGRARGRRDRLEPDRLHRDRDNCGAAAASIGAELCDGAGRGL